MTFSFSIISILASHIIFLFYFVVRLYQRALHKINTSNVISQSLNVATIREHTIVAETIAVLLGARFTSQVRRDKVEGGKSEM